jgi:Leucine-rich repeat (LRR) protein
VKSSTLQLLDISRSFLFHSVEDCKDVVKSSHKLTVLNLTGINLSTNRSETNLLRLFMPLKSIETLILSNTSMKMIPSDVFKEIDSLKILDLSRNAIEEWKTECFQNMSKRF